MQALRSLDHDLEVKVEQQEDFQVHRFFYKGVQIRKVHYRPAVYSSYKCSKCFGNRLCQVCDLNRMELTCSNDPIDLQISWYIARLFQVRQREISVSTFGGKCALYIRTRQIFELWSECWQWSDTRGICRGNSIEIFQDRLEITTPSDLIVFYKDHPFHKEILTELRKYKPFSEAPWF